MGTQDCQHRLAIWKNKHSHFKVAWLALKRCMQTWVKTFTEQQCVWACVCGKHRKHFRPAGTITTSQWRGCRCSGSAGPELKTLSISLTNVKHLNARLICISVFLLLLRRFLLTLIYLLTNIFCNMLKVLFVISSQLHQTIRGQYFPVRQCLVQTLFTIYLIYFICFYANSS